MKGCPFVEVFFILKLKLTMTIVNINMAIPNQLSSTKYENKRTASNERNDSAVRMIL